MPEQILMPELGESVHEGTVSRWLKQVGDSVKEDEPVVEIMTDKVNTELQAPASGTLIKILVPEGENVKVFEPLGLIGSPDEVSDNKTGSPAPPKESVAPVPARAESTPEESVAPTVTSHPVQESASNGRKWFTPVVRAMAKEHQVSDAELGSISGSGEGGRVTKRDLEAYLGQRTATAPVTAREAKPAVQESEPTIEPTKPRPDQEIITLTGMRKAIADAMTKAHQIPSVSTVTAVDMTKLVEFRKVNKDSFQQTHGVRLTYTPFFIKAIVESLVQFPMVNSAVADDGRLIRNNAVHMGVAVALGDGSQGLIVPVIRDAHKKNLIEIARELEGIAQRARDNKLDLSEIQGGTSTITNPGTYGALFGTPMIPPGQGSIIGTYAIQDTPVAINGSLAIRPIMHLVLSYDHRIIDGMLAGAFLKSVRDRLEAFDFFR
ncbi:MAG: 2-oxo acid dehydrogenase subunit E2 [Fimbriimonadales bacterium]|nr:2-oxo acid dehydrogenase subunit E2 [Fimbriimonadales bacterium]